MLPILVLVALCGVLAQDVQGDISAHVCVNVSPKLVQSVISKRVDRKTWVDKFMNLPLGDSLKNNQQQSGHKGGFLGISNLIGGVTSIFGSITGCKIKNVILPAPRIRFDGKKQQMEMKVPALLSMELNLPLTTINLLDFNMELQMIANIQSEKDSRTGRSRLVFKSCENIPGRLNVNFLGNKLPLINDLIRIVTSTFEQVVPTILQQIICPLITGVLQLFINILQGSFIPSAQDVYQMSADNFYITEHSMRIDYKGASLTTGGETQVALPPSKALPSVPMSDCSVNMLLDINFLQTIVKNQLPSQTLDVAESEKVIKFQEGIRRISNLSPGTIVNIVKISSNVPKVVLTSRKMTMVEEMEIQVPGQNNQNLCQIKAKVKLVVTPSVVGGKLIFLVNPESIPELSLVQSSFGTIDVSSLKSVVLELLRNAYMPHANRMLSTGFKLPAVEDFNVNDFKFNYQKDALELYSLEVAGDSLDNNWEDIKWKDA